MNIGDEMGKNVSLKSSSVEASIRLGYNTPKHPADPSSYTQFRPILIALSTRPPTRLINSGHSSIVESTTNSYSLLNLELLQRYECKPPLNSIQSAVLRLIANLFIFLLIGWTISAVTLSK